MGIKYPDYRLFVGIFFSLVGSTGGCSSEPYLYSYPPPEQDKEVLRICPEVWKRESKRFTVKSNYYWTFYSGVPLRHDYKLRPVQVHIDGQGSFYLNGVATTLPEGDYYCGRVGINNDPCAVGATRRVDGQSCSFSRD